MFNKMDDKVLFCGQGAGVMAVECDTGIFRAFEEKGIIPGQALTSSGSTLFSSLYYSGHNADWFHCLMDNVKLNKFFTISPVGTIKTLIGNARHILNNDGVKDLLEKYMTAKATLRVKTSITRMVDYTTHIVDVTPATALAATSIPYVFKPVNIEGELYVDGGVLNNIPVPKYEEIDNWKHVFIFLSPAADYRDLKDPLLIELFDLLQAIMDREVKQLDEIGYFGHPKVTVIRPTSSFGGNLLNWSTDKTLEKHCYELTKEALKNVELD